MEWEKEIFNLAGLTLVFTLVFIFALLDSLGYFGDNYLPESANKAAIKSYKNHIICFGIPCIILYSIYFLTN